LLCKYCESFESKVTDSRAIEDKNTIRRRRECIDCGHRWTTYEIDATELRGVKTNEQNERSKTD
jgi:transcriptional repressor NrdR